ncbi:hypothetical protein OPV22_010785 [Ensete ventricosum]|uniref:3-oxoacyl-[acyl-carrier-protein] reductase n=1 Tax=Ensete ventricosum TaxID=4639 RepID=A0AAV8RLY2_ENSVE|nr:hypothetical protein OPV22_010785 [Ensete ventricosum]
MAAEAGKMDQRSLKGKAVMVTGASSGIGREICLDLAAAGCKIVAAARRVDRLKALCDEINGSSNTVQAVVMELDVSRKSPAIEAAVHDAWNAFGRIDALVNNAGVRGGVYTAVDWSEEEWDRIMTTNLTGLWLVSKHVCIRMRDAKRKGSVINISSNGGTVRGLLPGSLAYVASKTGVNSITRVMALEMGRYGIRTNSVSPGIFKSEITERLMEKEWLGKVMRRTVPLGTFGTVNPAITSLIRYLVDDASEYVNGNDYIVDAGATLPGVPLFSSL